MRKEAASERMSAEAGQANHRFLCVIWACESSFGASEKIWDMEMEE